MSIVATLYLLIGIIALVLSRDEMATICFILSTLSYSIYKFNVIERKVEVLMR